MLVKCQYCRGKDEKDAMKKVTTGKKTKINKYYHFNCYEKYLKEQEFKDKERQELDDLYSTIKGIYGIPENEILPSQFFPFLQELRNGSVVHGKIKKAFKKGVRYSALNITYQFCENKIRYAKSNKEFKNFLAELKYGLAIVRNNLEDAKREYRRKQRQKQVEDRVSHNKEEFHYQEYKPKKENNKKDKMDISNFL